MFGLMGRSSWIWGSEDYLVRYYIYVSVDLRGYGWAQTPSYTCTILSSVTQSVSCHAFLSFVSASDGIVSE